MAPRNEPPWLTKLYAGFGFLLIFLIIAALYMAVAYWPITLLLGGSAFGAWWYFRSPWGLERKAREEVERLYRQAGEISKAPPGFIEPTEFSDKLIDAIRARKLQPRFTIFKAIMDC
jgi:hypothetical protein